MPELSPAAIAVDDALAACIQLQGEIIRARPLAAAALRAAANQVEHKWRGLGHEACQEIRAIADELEAHG